MPLSPQQRMKQSALKQEAAVTLSAAEKEARQLAKKEKREVAAEEAGSGIPQWVITAVAIAVLGSVFAQLYFTITTSPSMSKEH